MKTRNIMKTLSGVTAATLLITGAALANSNAQLNAEQQASSNKAIHAQAEKQNAMLQAINENVAAGFEKVKLAMRLLTQPEQNEQKQKAAIEALEAASAKFDIALVAKPDLGLIPVDSHVTISELITTPDAIHKVTDEAIYLLNDGKLIQARELLAPMRDDMISQTTLLPMKTYPDVIKQATAELIKGNREKAVNMINQAFSTFVIKRSVLPLSLLRAEGFLIDASKLDKKKDKEKILGLLDAAQSQLEVATLMGYTDEKSKAYEDLKTQIKALKKEVKGKNVVEKLYHRLKQSFRHLIDEEGTQKAVKQ